MAKFETKTIEIYKVAIPGYGELVGTTNDGKYASITFVKDSPNANDPDRTQTIEKAMEGKDETFMIAFHRGLKTITDEMKQNGK